MKQNFFLCALLIGWAIQLQAKTVEVTETWALGESISIDEGRRYLRLKAQKKALSALSPFIERQLTTDGVHVNREQISLYSAAVVSSTVLNEHVDIIQSRYPVLKQTISFEINTEELAEKIKSVGPKWSNTIEKLANENLELTRQLEEIQSQWQDNPRNVSEKLITRQRLLIDTIQKNRKQAIHVLREGDAFQLAENTELALERAQRDIDIFFFDSLSRKIVINLSKPTIRVTDTGNYDMDLMVSWSMDARTLYSALRRHFKINPERVKREGRFRVKVLPEEADAQLGAETYAPALFDYLLARPVLLVIIADENKAVIRLSEVHCFLGCRKESRHIYKLHVNGGPRKVTIRDIKPERLPYIQSLSAMIVIGDPEKER